MSAFALRPARPDDWPRLWRLDQACFSPELAYSRRELDAYAHLPGAFTLVAEAIAETREETPAGRSESLAGFMIAAAERRQGHIVTLDVLPAFQRRGLGAQFMAAADERFRERGLSTVALEVAVNNLAAVAFYHRLGFRVVKILSGYYALDLDAFSMRKPLAPLFRPAASEASAG